MPKSKMGIRITIVVEDRMLERFVRECLVKLGYHLREIRVECAPPSRGSGKQWVDKRFVVEVKAIRAKNYQQLAVLVGTDVDQLELKQRANQLTNALMVDGTGDRSASERISYWLPRWSIETWLKRLAGDEVDEITRYKHQLDKLSFEKLGNKFVTNYREKDDLGLPSIAFTFSEIPRIES